MIPVDAPMDTTDAPMDTTGHAVGTAKGCINDFIDDSAVTPQYSSR